MRIYKIAHKTDSEIQAWIDQFVQERGGIQACLYGLCFDLAQELNYFLKNDGEVWSLWNIDWRIEETFPFVFPEGEKILDYLNPDTIDQNYLNNLIDKEIMLIDIGDEIHGVVKYNNSFWDAKGKHNSLEEVSKNFDSLRNPHWFRVE